MIKKAFLIFLIFIYSCYAPPTIYVPSGSYNLSKSINSIINGSEIKTNIAVKAVNLISGEILIDLNSHSLFNPASNNKLYTSISALGILDTNFTFNTSVYSDTKAIYLVGGGDPDLTLEQLDSLATITAKKNSPGKRLVIDDSILDTLVYGPGWMWDEGDEWYSAQISGLSVNDNCIDFIVNPADNGKLIDIQILPQSDYYTFLNEAYTVNDTTNFKKLKISRDWKNKNNNFLITGSIMDTTSSDTIIRNVHDPTLFTGYLFKEMLQKKGLPISALEKGNRSSSSLKIASHRSSSLISIVENLMVESDNLTAEILVKIIGHHTTGDQGNWKNGLHAMRLYLNDQVGLDTTNFSISDGSGVSRYNYSSASHFIDLLSWIYNTSNIRDIYLKTLSYTGENGTLLDRNLPDGIYAKTGSLSGVSTFSGYIIHPSKDPIAFSILMNGHKGSSFSFRALQDRIVSQIASF